MKRFIVVLAVAISLISNHAAAFTPQKIVRTGPGEKIHGMDISYWQHPYGQAIDFKKMYAAGIRFVMIKGGDSHDTADAQARKYLVSDRLAAQRVGLFTGFYYYAYLPDSTEAAFIIADATAQAQKAVWRLATIGGYKFRDLPMALDLENNCVRVNSAGRCAKYMSREGVALWAQTWLDAVTSKTSRKPMFYSYTNFLENAIAKSSALRQYPLWLARYSLDPANSQPNAKNVGCYAHSWTNGNCTAQWQIWQYTSCGIAGKYGVPGNRVDLNVFGGTANQFYTLARGSWEPQLSDQLPVNEPTTMSIASQASTTTIAPTTFVVDVVRPDSSPVVTGTVGFKSLDSLMPSGNQRAVRSASGRWSLSITGLVAGHYLGLIEFIDITGTHAQSSFPVEFDITQGVTPTPTPKPTPSPTKTNPPTDSCAGQIRN